MLSELGIPALGIQMVCNENYESYIETLPVFLDLENLA